MDDDALKELKIDREYIKPENINELTINLLTEIFSCEKPEFYEIDKEIISSSQNMLEYTQESPEISFTVSIVAEHLGISKKKVLEWFRKGMFIVMEENA
jgi:hypothetical protein